MMFEKLNRKVSKTVCNTALKIAHKTVETEEDLPICTIIIHQPEIPEKLKLSQNVRKVR